MLDKKPERRLLGKLYGPLDLVHRCDSLAFFLMNQVYLRRHVSPVIGLAVNGRMQGVQHARMLSEPGGELADARTFGVIEVLFLAEEFDGLSSATEHRSEMAHLEPLAHAHVSRHRPQHQ